VLKIGSCAAEAFEPRQVREEAAVSNAVCVVDDSGLSFTGVEAFSVRLDKGCAAKVYYSGRGIMVFPSLK